MLVGEHVQTPYLNYQTGSSHYASATSEPDSDSPRVPQRKSLGPSGAKYLRSRANRPDQRPAGPSRTSEESDRQEERQIPTGRATPTTNSSESSNKLDEYFQMAMNRFLKEQSLVTVQPPPLGTQDFDIESVGTPDPDSWESDPDDIGIPSSSGHNFDREDVASPAISSRGSSRIQRVRISAISDLKEFTGKDMDEDRARAWIGKVKSGFQRYQATVEEKCLTFADLTVGPAKNCHRQLSRTTKIKWADLLESFQTQYCGLGMSVAWQYYHARKRSDENPLIKDGNPKARRGHVDHYIETLGEPELTDRLTLLRLADVDEFGEVLRARGRAKSRQRRSAFGSKFRQKTPPSAPTAPTRAAVRAIQAHDPSSESEGISGYDGSDSEGDLRMIFLAAAEEKTQIQRGPERKRLRDPRSSQSGRQGSPRSRVLFPLRTRKRTDLDCWKRLICEKCGKRGHPTDRCLYARRGCWGVHKAGECLIEQFYNQIRK
ncbi:hypothetical protein PHMEG_00032349 [Phytophthora megakarya]|uniref:CCHC-type domain-containing protein n=1 Tax=Phytophthora megakarya TaxID=4795 RepID=A0A225UUX3_9STRA|nr:hypothetical protein PHMEG_00032349 [Phytophthora megakarya]